MRKVIEWVVTHPTVVNLFMVGVVVAGFFAIDVMPKESFPETSFDVIVVEAQYRGAGPKEIENGILIKVEEAIQGISGISQVSSEAKENIGVIRVELNRGTDVAEALRDVKDKVEQISGYPTDAETPRTYQASRRVPVLYYALSGTLKRSQLQSLAQHVKDELLSTDGISLVNVNGMKEREISIEIDEVSLRKYQLQISDITQALKFANLDLSGGVVKTKREDFRIRFYGKKYLAKDLEQIVVRTLPGGGFVRLRDVAKAREAFADTGTQFYYNGKPSILIELQSTSDANILKVAKLARAKMATIIPTLPKGAQVDTYKDNTQPLNERISLLANNGFQGLILVLLVLSFFMNVRLAMWVASGLLLSIIGSFTLALGGGLTINMMSLFGLILVIGILVDDAIVVAENVFSHIEAGKSPAQAAIDGTVEVLPAVLTAVITTCLTFLPLFFMGGFIGKFIYMIPAMVIAALVCSLFESLLILPPHLAHSLKPRGSAEFTQNRFRTLVDKGFGWLREDVYGRSLKWLLRWRWPVLAGSIGVFLLSLGLLQGGFVRFVFFPEIDGDQIAVRFVMKPGTPLEKTRAVAERAEKAAAEVAKELKQQYKQEIVESSVRWLGRLTAMSPGFSSATGDEVGEVQLNLLSGDKRKLSANDVLRRWREKVGSVSGALSVSFDLLGTPPLGKPLEFQLLSDDVKQLRAASSYLKKRLLTFGGVYTPEDDLEDGKRELRMSLTPLAKSMGLSMQDLATKLRNRVYGQEVMNLQRRKDEVRVFVRYPSKGPSLLQSFSQVEITTRDGKRIPLSLLVKWNVVKDLKVIRRLNRQRLATVSARLDESQGNRQDIIQSLKRKDLKKLAVIAPNVRVVFSGQSKEQAKVFAGMRYAFPMAMFGIFFVMVLIFQSYSQSIIVMAMIPFGVVGAILGHWVMGVPLTILSFFGIVGVSGVVVNDSIILMDTINRKFEE